MSERGTKLSKGGPNFQAFQQKVPLRDLALKEGPSCEHCFTHVIVTAEIKHAAQIWNDFKYEGDIA